MVLTWAEARARWAETEEKEKGRRDRFEILKRFKANEFKLRFEFNQTKIVLQHECNNKLLWFINLLKKIIKCL
jgi:hypothetical protein